MPKKSYKKHFKRELAENIQPTKRDREIMRLVHEYRFLSSDCLLRLIPGGQQGIGRRLKLLFHNGYLDRPRAQRLRFGNHPMVYALGNKGAELLAQNSGLARLKGNWTAKNRESGNVFLEHTLMVSRFMAIMRLACQKIKEVEFIEPETIISQRPLPAPDKAHPLSWRVKASGSLPGQKRQITFNLVPDGVFGLRVDLQGKIRTFLFFLEADQSTMPIHSRDLRRSSFYKKLLGYWSSWEQGLFAKIYGCRKPRLLTITISKERITSMIEANKKLDKRGRGLRMFLFAQADTFNLDKPELVFSEQAWLNGRNDLSSIIS